MKIKNPIILIIAIIILVSLIPFPGEIVKELIKPFIGTTFLNNFEINIKTFIEGISGIITIITTLLFIYLYNKHYKKIWI